MVFGHIQQGQVIDDMRFDICVALYFGKIYAIGKQMSRDFFVFFGLRVKLW